MTSLTAERTPRNKLEREDDLALSSIVVALKHSPELFDLASLVRLASTSASTQALVAGLWKVLWKRAVAAGQQPTSEIVEGKISPYVRATQTQHKRQTWDGEDGESNLIMARVFAAAIEMNVGRASNSVFLFCFPQYLTAGLLPCFSAPDVRILKRVGYQRAAVCLLTKTCFDCGALTAHANPFSMKRICQPCATMDERSWFMSKTKAKETFCLTYVYLLLLLLESNETRDHCSLLCSPITLFPSTSAKDCANLPGVSMSRANLLLISDVQAASFTKWGGVEGLAEEIFSRKVMGNNKYEKQLSTDKPMKKRPKICQLPLRPAEDLASLRFWAVGAFPITTAHTVRVETIAGFESKLAMAQPTKCQLCDLTGLLNDVCLHELVEHGMSLIDSPDAILFEHSQFSIKNLVPDEVAHLLKSADISHTECAREETIRMNLGGEFGGFEGFDDSFLENSLYTMTCRVVVGDIVVTMEYDTWSMSECGGGSFEICAQTKTKSAPMVLLTILFGENAHYPDFECGASLQSLLKAANLSNTDPAELLAALIYYAMPNYLDPDIASFAPEEPSMEEMPIYASAFAILTDREAAQSCSETSSEPSE